MKRYILLLFASIVPFMMSGQNSDILNGKEEINRIKREADSFIFAETTMENQEEAKSLARDFLYEYISQWMKQNTDSLSFSADSLDSMTIYIVTSRGPMFRVLAYVPKNNLPGYDPAAQRPSAKEPESVFAEPAVIAPVEPVVTETVEPAVPTEAQLADQAYDFIVSRVMTATSKDELISILYSEEMRACCRYGEIDAATNPSSLSDCTLVIYSKDSGQIQAVLSKKSPYRINLRTKEKDSTSHYPQCGAIWLSPTINNK